MKYHMISHKMILNTFRKTEITSSILLGYSSMKLEINYKKKTFPSPKEIPSSGIEPRSPELQADSLLAEPQGKPNASTQ